MKTKPSKSSRFFKKSLNQEKDFSSSGFQFNFSQSSEAVTVTSNVTSEKKSDQVTTDSKSGDQVTTYSKSGDQVTTGLKSGDLVTTDPNCGDLVTASQNATNLATESSKVTTKPDDKSTKFKYQQSDNSFRFNFAP